MFGKKIKKVVSIEGMHCNHCAMKVQDALGNLDGVKGVKVNLDKKEAIVTLDKEINCDLIKEAIAKIDFLVTDIK